jgi:penicillin-binding protein 1A
MGITPGLVTGVWVGGERREIRFRSMALGQGAKMALPIFGYYMQKVYADQSLGIPVEVFQKPENVNIQTDCGLSDSTNFSLHSDSVNFDSTLYLYENKMPDDMGDDK